jgi:hypothetical protein
VVLLTIILQIFFSSHVESLLLLGGNRARLGKRVQKPVPGRLGDMLKEYNLVKSVEMC